MSFDWLTPVIGGTMGLVGQHVAHLQNREFADATNRFNREERERSQAWNRQQWLDMLAYNTPTKQRERYEEAGINPYLALGNITAGNAQGATSTTPASGSLPAPMQNVAAPLQQGLMDSVNTAMQSKVVDAEIKKKEAEAYLTLKKAGTHDDEAKARIKADLSGATLSMANANSVDSLTPVQIKQGLADIEVKVSQSAVNDSIAKLNLDELTNLRPLERKELESRLRVNTAFVYYYYKMGELSEKQARLVLEEVNTEQLRQRGIRIGTGKDALDFLLYYKTFDKHLDKVELDNDAKRLQNENQRTENSWQSFEKGVNVVEKVGGLAIRAGAAFATGGFSEMGRTEVRNETGTKGQSETVHYDANGNVKGRTVRTSSANSSGNSSGRSVRRRR